MNRYIKLLFLFYTLVLTSGINAQAVTVSKEMTIRNDVAYDIIGVIEDNILLYRDKGTERVVEVFDKNMKHLYEKKIILDKKNADVYAIVPQDTCFSVIYGYRQRKKYYMRALKFNQFGNQIDSTTYINGEEEFRLHGLLRPISSHMVGRIDR